MNWPVIYFVVLIYIYIYICIYIWYSLIFIAPSVFSISIFTSRKALILISVVCISISHTRGPYFLIVTLYDMHP